MKAATRKKRRALRPSGDSMVPELVELASLYASQGGIRGRDDFQASGRNRGRKRKRTESP